MIGIREAMCICTDASRIFVQESVIKVLVMVITQNGKINNTDTTWSYFSEFWKYNVLLEGRLEDNGTLAT